MYKSERLQRFHNNSFNLGQEIFHELAKNSDIIVENFNLGVTERLNIDYKTIKKINP